jgi:hypothetical protein
LFNCETPAISCQELLALGLYFIRRKREFYD